MGNVTRAFSAIAVSGLLALTGCGGKAERPGLTQAEAAALVTSDAVVDLVRVTSVRDVGGVIEINCATQVPVQIISEYPGSGGPKSVRHDVEPPVTTLRIQDLNRDARGKIILKPR